MSILRVLLVLLSVGSATPAVIGQATNYWNENFGPHSILLNGAVIGSVNDLGAVFYNPARLNKEVTSAFTLNTKAYQYTTIHVKDGSGMGLDLNKSDFNAIPSLAAGQFSFKKLPRQKFAYSFLTYTSVDVNFFVREEDIYGDIISGIPGDELFTGQNELARRVNDEWMGLTWSYEVNPVFSIGVSGFVSRYKQETTLDLDLRALLEDSHVALLGYRRYYSISDISLIWKVGMSLDFDKVSLGMTLTTPRLNMGGSGSFEYEDFLSGLEAAREDLKDKYVASYQGDLNTKYHSPVSIGLGMGCSLGRNTLHIATQWFSSVGGYDMIDINPFTGQSTGEAYAYQIGDQRDNVLNAGIGADIFIADKVTLLFSFATDFSSRKSALDIIEGVTDTKESSFGSDFFHYGLGLSFSAKWAEVSFGSTFSHSNYYAQRPVNFPDENQQPVFDETLANVKQKRWRFILGITLPFMKDIMKSDEPGETGNL